MTENLKKLLNGIKKPEPDSLLFQKIISRIGKETESDSLERGLFIFFPLFLSSMASFFPAANLIKSEMYSSNILVYLSLLWSDFNEVAANNKSFILAIAESLPLTSIIIVLTILAIFLFSLRSLAKNLKIKKVFLRLN